ncbi:MAG TPA: pitrilysin family protein [Myxococcaceae bacterium]|nr:pitrilysin family protein [Myxococcaceae bacterium]
MAARKTQTRSRADDAWSLPPLFESQTREGMKVIVMPRGTLPLVTVRVVIEAGSAYDPKGKEGLADFTIRLMRRGAAGMSAKELDDAIEFTGSSLSVGVSEELMILHLTCPEAHLKAMLGVVGKVLARPDFPEDELERLRSRTIAQLVNEQDDPGALAERAQTEAYWGRHPYGHDTSGTRKSVKRFTREDVVAFHRDRMGPRVALAAVVGAVEPKATARMVERAFADFTGGPEKRTHFEAPASVPQGQVLIVDKPEQTQAQVRLAGPAYPFADPAHFPAVVMNVALGGGFTSRLINEIRVNRGLTYGISSGFAPMRAAGMFLVSTFTKTGTAHEIIRRTLDELHKLRRGGLSSEELTHAQTYLAGLYPLRNETHDALAASLAELITYGQGPEWIEQYRARVRAVTLDEANEAARNWLYREPPLVVVVGRASELKGPLADFGEVTVKPAASFA